MIADTYRKMSELEKAIPYFQNAIRLDSEHANAHLLRLTYQKLNRGERAKVLRRPWNSSPNIRKRTGGSRELAKGGYECVTDRALPGWARGLWDRAGDGPRPRKVYGPFR